MIFTQEGMNYNKWYENQFPILILILPCVTMPIRDPCRPQGMCPFTRYQMLKLIIIYGIDSSSHSSCWLYKISFMGLFSKGVYPLEIIITHFMDYGASNIMT